jgi:prepilin-type N-terminal cleavage/methylation domain-containing protein
VKKENKSEIENPRFFASLRMISVTGFTLTEVLIVVAILGILASLALPRFFPSTEKARVSEAIGILSAIRQGEEAYWLENGVYLAITVSAADTAIPPAPGDPPWPQLGIDNPNNASGRFFNYTVALNGAGFIATAARNNTKDVAAQVGKIITLNQTGSYCDATAKSTHMNTPGGVCP